ncbi:Transmembrane and coiled-coil domain-containing protein 4 [Galemys pyrenaicus]|uniref:Transmembrane and coiled-coil domain-containing protein 4 n=1 Tax=Galemys pyrenaicus TaxID=202257 RepID=A0A8J5ZT82_GALPY|nr:Transmembrane and coiled-coil domain-containing protein 4 [Galemys pyrenaicus]
MTLELGMYGRATLGEEGLPAPTCRRGASCSPGDRRCHPAVNCRLPACTHTQCDGNCQGIIEDVVLLGAPVEGDARHWEPFRMVVSGRIINGYSRSDWLLSFVYRTSSVQLRVAGLQPVTLQDRRVENVDLSAVVSGHLDYAKQMDVILKAVGIRTKPGWDEKGLLLAPSCLPQEEPRQTAASSASNEATHQDAQALGPPPGDTPQVGTAAEPSPAQVPTGLGQPEEASLPAAASPSEGPQICSHGIGANPLGCPDCQPEPGPCPDQD